ncbi:MAG: type IV pilin N-terminal domain-containing protein [Candidatus Aenigmatarchaeota archaeon]
MKAVSPLIAAVLLIAFTVAVAAIIGTFLTGLTRTTVGGVERGTAGQAECAGVYIDVLQYNSNAGTAAFRNPSGSNRIYVTSAVNESGISTRNFTTIVLEPGRVKTAILNVSTNETHVFDSLKSAKKVTFLGFCETTAGQNISITGECSKGQPCWNS